MRPLAGTVGAVLGLALPLAFPALAAAATTPLTSYDDLMDALQDGAPVRVVVHYAECRMIADNEEDTAPDAVGGMDVDTFEAFAAGAVGNPEAFLVFSHASLIEHPRRGFVLNHVKFRVGSGGEITVEARYLDPGTHEVTMEEKFFTSFADGAARFVRLD